MSNKNTKKGFWYFYDKVVDILAQIAGYSLAGISILITVDVLMRYVFKSPFSFTMPISELIMVLILALGGTYLLREQDFIRVDIIVQFLPIKVRTWMRVITDFIAAALFVIIGCGTAVKFWELYQSKAIIINSGANWKHWVYMLPLVVFFFVIPLQLIRNSINAYKDMKEGKIGLSSTETVAAEMIAESEENIEREEN